jgi:transcription antitermination factor NusG
MENLNEMLRGLVSDDDRVRYEAIATERSARARRYVPQASDVIPASFPIGERWCVIYTDAGEEERVRQELAMAEFRVYLPCVTRWATHGIGRRARHRPTVERPLFPRYLFANIDFNRRFTAMREVQDIKGASHILANAGVPMFVPGGDVLALMEAESAGLFDETREHAAAPPFGPGQRVRVRQGDQVFIAEVLRARPHERISVLINRCRVTLPLDAVEPE